MPAISKPVYMTEKGLQKAQSELETVDRRIRELRFKLEHAQLIQQAGQNELITLGSTVVIQEKGASAEIYTIVGSDEADPDQGCISNESPLGKALLSHTLGDEVAVDSPGGPLLFRIMSIS